MTATVTTLPSQQQLLLPVLQSLAANGGQAKTTDLYAAVAERTAVPAAVRTATETLESAGTINTFARSIRWAQQRGKLLGLMQPVSGGVWTLTEKGRKALRESQPGVVITVFVTDSGAALWAAAEDAVGLLDDASVALLMTSPPYALQRQKEYGNKTATAYLDWFLSLAKEWPKKLTPDGSIVLNLGDAFEAGRPTLSLYQERLLVKLVDEVGLRLCQRFAWQSPSRMPAPAEWVTIRRVRVKNTLEQVYWLSPNDQPYSDNRQVLVPYSERMKSRIREGGEKKAARPSGYAFAAHAFGKDNGGAIPGNLIVAPNTVSNDRYLNGCRRDGIPLHPARFPAALPEFFIKFLTRPGDLVFDPFGGSGTTGAVAETLGRRWVTCDQVFLSATAPLAVPGKSYH